MPIRKTSVKTLRTATIVFLLLFVASAKVRAQETATWLPAGPSQNYSNPSNWSGGVVPINGLNGPDTYAVTIGSETVNFDVVGVNRINELSLIQGSGLNFGAGRSLQIMGEAEISGLVTVDGGTFLANNSGTTLNHNARLILENGAYASVAATSYRNIATDGELFAARGGSHLNLSSLTNLSTQNGGSKKITASNSTITLSNLVNIGDTDSDSGDFEFRWEAGGNIQLDSLQTINAQFVGSGNRARFYYEANRNFLLNIHSAKNTEFHLATNTSLHLPNLHTLSSTINPYLYSTVDLQFGAVLTANNTQFTQLNGIIFNIPNGATFNAPHANSLINSRLNLTSGSNFNTPLLDEIDSTQIAVSGNFTFNKVRDTSYILTRNVGGEDIFSARAGATLILSSLENIVYGGSARIAANSATIDLSNVRTLDGAAHSGLTLQWEVGGEIRLDSLRNINPSGISGIRFLYEANRSFTLPAQTAFTTEFHLPVNTQLDLPNLTSLTGSSVLNLNAGSKLRMPAMQRLETTTISAVGNNTLIDLGGTVASDGNLGRLTIAHGATLRLRGDLLFYQGHEPWINTSLGIINFAGSSLQRLEVGGVDEGNTGTITTNNGNFGLGQLIVGTEDQTSLLQLTDQIDNQNRFGNSEALYLYGYGGQSGLQILNNSTLVLNGINVYSWDALSNTSIHLNSLFGPGVLSIPFGDGRIQLTSGVGPFAWANSGSSNWSSVNNWNPQFIPNGDFKAVFAGGVGGPTTVTVDDDIQIGEVEFNNPSHSFTIAGDGSHGLELVGASKIEVSAGTHVISAPILGNNGLTKTGEGTLILSGNNTFTGTTQIQAGTVRASSPQNFGQSETIDLAVGATLDLTAAGLFSIGANRTLAGKGNVQANLLAVPDSSTLRGSMKITGNVVNAGSVAPGNSPGIMTIIGNYSQQSSGTLEMEVGGTTPGTQHDMLIVTGTASLSGRLDVELIDGFVPQPGNEMLLLLASNVVGDFDSHSVPNLASINPDVAVDVQTSANGVRLRFVTPLNNNGFNGTAATANWSDTSNWITGLVPAKVDNITVENQSSINQQLDVYELPSLPGSKNAFTHELTIIGDAQTMAVTVQEGSSLSATLGVNVENRGIVELEGGAIATNILAVEDGGTLKGSGEIFGNYTQSSGGQLTMTLVDDTTFDTLDISKNATLDGTLRITIPDGGSVELGDTFEIITAGDLLGTTFDTLDVIGADNVFLALDYQDGLVSLITFNTGDMNRSGDESPTQDDIAAFALALTNPSKYFDDFGASSNSAGDIDGDGDCDVDDIDNFKALLPNMSMAEFQYRMTQALSVPEPSGMVLSISGFLIFAGRHKFSLRHQ
jgi:autotransporter-associated beta strand protein